MRELTEAEREGSCQLSVVSGQWSVVSKKQALRRGPLRQAQGRLSLRSVARGNFWAALPRADALG
jgi:hypothetical protein